METQWNSLVGTLDFWCLGHGGTNPSKNKTLSRDFRRIKLRHVGIRSSGQPPASFQSGELCFTPKKRAKSLVLRTRHGRGWKCSSANGGAEDSPTKTEDLGQDCLRQSAFDRLVRCAGALRHLRSGRKRPHHSRGMLFAPADSECQDLARPDDVFSLADFCFFRKHSKTLVICNFLCWWFYNILHTVLVPCSCYPLLRFLVPVILVNFIFFVARLLTRFLLKRSLWRCRQRQQRNYHRGGVSESLGHWKGCIQLFEGILEQRSQGDETEWMRPLAKQQFKNLVKQLQELLGLSIDWICFFHRRIPKVTHLLSANCVCRTQDRSDLIEWLQQEYETTSALYSMPSVLILCVVPWQVSPMIKESLQHQCLATEKNAGYVSVKFMVVIYAAGFWNTYTYPSI